MRSRNVLCGVAAAILITACGQGGTPEQPPAAPSNVTATPGPGYVEVEWQDESTTETGFAVYRTAAAEPLGAAQADSKVGEVEANVERFVDGDVEPGATYKYEVVALGAAGESERTSAAAASVPVGIGAMVGHVNNPFEPRTSIFFLPSIPEDEIAGGVSLKIEGPPGWNGDEPIDGPISESAARNWMARLVLTPPVPGDYTVTATTESNEYVTVATLPGDPKIYPLPTGIEVTEASDSAVTATWTSDPDYESYFVAVFDSDWSTLVGGYEATNANTHTIDSLSLDVGTYRFVVPGFPVDLVGQPVMIDDYGQSYNGSDPFVISAIGTSCVSGTPITDSGLAEAFADTLGIEGSPDCGQVATPEVVDASGRGVSDVSGLEFAVNLLDLQLDNNQISDLSFAQDLPALRYLYFGGNPVSSMEPLRGLPLNGISLWGTDVQPEHAANVVESLSDLQILFMGGAGPSDMSFLEGLSLHILDYGHNGATSLPDLSNSTMLHSVNVEGNELSSVSDLDALIDAFQGRTPEDWWWMDSFEVFIHNNRFDLSDPEVMDRIDDLIAMGVAVTYEPQNEAPAP